MLVDAKLTNFKLFDFDYSFTTKQKNYQILKKIEFDDKDEKIFIEKGFIFDCLKFYYDIISTDGKYKDMCKNEDILIKKIDTTIEKLCKTYNSTGDEDKSINDDKLLENGVNIMYDNVDIKKIFFPDSQSENHGGSNIFYYKYIKYKNQYLGLN